MIQALAGYVHQVLGVPARLEIDKHLGQTLRGETALHTLKQRYRDHFFHTIEVCLIGHWLLLSRPDPAKKQTLADLLVLKCGKAKTARLAALKSRPDEQKKENERWHVPESARDFIANWWLAALSHDTAYGIDVLRGTLDLLSYFQNQKGEAMKGFIGEVKGCIAKLGENLRGLAPEFDADDSIKKGDHGLITGGHLRQSLQNLDLESGKADAQELYHPAVRAVAFHNTRHPKVVAERDPVAALLILCDTVQDWGRSQLGFTRSPAEVLSRIVEGGATPSDEQFGPVEAFYFAMKQIAPSPKGMARNGNKRPRIHKWDKKNKMEIRLHYAPWMTEKPDCREKVFYSWADMTYNLQRVDFSGWGLDLRIVQRTPFAEKWKRELAGLPVEDQNATELDRLAAMIREQSAWNLLGHWLEEVGRKSEASALAHKVERDWDLEAGCRWEILSFNLCQLGQRFLEKRALMKADVGEFGQIVEKWSKRLTTPLEKQPEQKPPK